MRSLAAGGKFTFGAGADAINRDLSWSRRTARGRDLRIVDAVLACRSPARCLDEAEAVLHRLKDEAPIDILSVEIADPRGADGKLEGFQRRGAYLVCEHRYAREALLTLEDDWEDFLNGLGRKTRRNMRRFRRRAGAAGLRFSLADEAPSSVDAEARHRLGAATRPAPRSATYIDACDVFIRARTHPFVGRLREGDGATAAMVVGFITGQSAYIAYQLHHSRHEKLSLSLTMRSHLTEALIRQGVRELIFPNGCQGQLRSACRPQPISTVAFIRAGPVALTKALALVLRAPAHPASESIRHAMSRGS